jgi:hypothetical protein
MIISREKKIVIFKFFIRWGSSFILDERIEAEFLEFPK